MNFYDFLNLKLILLINIYKTGIKANIKKIIKKNYS
jgi:hypothetical protein